MLLVKKWIFKNECDEFGIVIRNKTRLIAQGYNKIKGIDVHETFAPVSRIEFVVCYYLWLVFCTSNYIRWMLNMHS